MSKFELSPVTKAFRKQCKEHLPPSSRLIAGVSGGPDSMALMYLLHRFEKDAVIVHCNYQLRGEDSEKDQRLVEKMSSFWGFECVAVRLESAEEANFQDWARNRRYEIFYDLKKEFNAHFITTAHHQDDQIETVLQRILRGSGMAAWKGMRVLDGQLFRPLLDVTKSDILKFVQAMNIPYRIDNSNEESTYARNFLRHNWFPELHRFFPGWRDNIMKLPDRALEYQQMADWILDQIRENRRSLNRSSFMALPERLQPALLHRFVEQLNRDIDVSSAIKTVPESLRELQSGKAIQISEKYQFIRDRNVFTLQEVGGGKRKPVTIQKDDLDQVGAVYGVEIRVEKFEGNYRGENLYLDESKIKFPITIRQWRDGDTIQPLGMTGNQLISDHLTNRKISSALKSEAFLIESFDETVCAVIFPHKTSDDQIGTVSETVRCSSDTKQVVVVRNK